MIDQEKGLQTLMNNSKIYNNILNRFYDKYNNISQELLKLLNNGDYDELYYHIHTIKGLSLNLGAITLYSLSMNLNDQYKQEKLVDIKLIKQFITELEIVLKEINEIKK